MGNNSVLSILNNEGLTEEEKTVLLKLLAHQTLDVEKENYSSYDSSSRIEAKAQKPIESYDDSQKKLIIENRKKAEEHRKRLERINRNSEINEKVKILSHLKNKMGENQFSEEFLNSISGFELDSIYEDCKRTMPTYMKEAMEELKKENENKTAKPVVEEKEPVSTPIIEEKPAEVNEPVKESDEKKAEDAPVVEESKEEIKESSEPLRLEGPVLESSKEANQVEVVPEVSEPEMKVSTNPLFEMTSDEIGYLYELKKIEEEQGVSIEEAEAIYKSRNNSKETENSQEAVEENNASEINPVEPKQEVNEPIKSEEVSSEPINKNENEPVEDSVIMPEVPEEEPKGIPNEYGYIMPDEPISYKSEDTKIIDVDPKEMSDIPENGVDYTSRLGTDSDIINKSTESNLRDIRQKDKWSKRVRASKIVNKVLSLFNKATRIGDEKITNRTMLDVDASETGYDEPVADEMDDFIEKELNR